MAFNERDRLILTFSELADERQHGESDEDLEYATSSEAFLDQSILKFVVDEVHAMMHIMFCDVGFLTTFYNPLYAALFLLLFILTYPGALLHWMLLDYIPVRKVEMPEERELRAQGIYTAIGIAVISIPFAAIGLYLGTDVMILINEISLAVNSCIIVTNLIGLKVIAEEYGTSVRIYIIGAWIIVTFLIGLAMFDVYAYMTLSWISAIDYFFRVLEIFIYTVIAIQSIVFWDLYPYSRASHIRSDIMYSVILSILFVAVIVGFVVATVISVEKSWRIMYW